MMKALLLMVAGAALAGGGFLLFKKLTAPDPNVYEPNASEVPLKVDFEPAAEKRVQPENYKQELTHIERELIQLARQPEP